MCVVSFIGDHYHDRISPFDPSKPFVPVQPYQPGQTTTIDFTWKPEVTKAEFDELKKMVEEMLELMRKAKIYDEENGEPDCEMDEKLAALKGIAKLVGLDLEQALKLLKDDDGS